MNTSNIKIQTNRRPGSLDVDIIFYSQGKGSDIIYYSIDVDGHLVEHQYSKGDIVKPVMVMPEAIYRLLLQSFVDEANGVGVETHESYVKGKLEATEHHLLRAEKLIDLLLPKVTS